MPSKDLLNNDAILKTWEKEFSSGAVPPVYAIMNVFMLLNNMLKCIVTMNNSELIGINRENKQKLYYILYMWIDTKNTMVRSVSVINMIRTWWFLEFN